MQTWRDAVKPIADRAALAGKLEGVQLTLGPEGAAALAVLLNEMADRLDAINAEAQAQAALRLGFRDG